jgi:hypothetical protein
LTFNFFEKPFCKTWTWKFLKNSKIFEKLEKDVWRNFNNLKKLEKTKNFWQNYKNWTILETWKNLIENFSKTWKYLKNIWKTFEKLSINFWKYFCKNMKKLEILEKFLKSFFWKTWKTFWKTSNIWENFRKTLKNQSRKNFKNWKILETENLIKFDWMKNFQKLEKHL